MLLQVDCFPWVLFFLKGHDSFLKGLFSFGSPWFSYQSMNAVAGKGMVMLAQPCSTSVLCGHGW